MASLRAIHRIVGLTLASFWALQAVTGAMLVFHWEIDDWTVRGPNAPLAPAAFSRGLAAIAATHPGRKITAVYASAGASGRS